MIYFRSLSGNKYYFKGEIIMQIQIRPALYGSNIRYEAYALSTKKSFWRGTVMQWQQVFYEKRIDGFFLSSEWKWEQFSSDKKEGDIGEYRSFDSPRQAEEILTEIFGTNLNLLCWRPDSQE